MKTRTDFVTNSSSSSFIITNTSGTVMTSEDVARSLVAQIIEDAKGRFELQPGESIHYECGDHEDDGAFEVFIHNKVDNWGGCKGWIDMFGDGKATVEFGESHH